MCFDKRELFAKHFDIFINIQSLSHAKGFNNNNFKWASKIGHNICFFIAWGSAVTGCGLVSPFFALNCLFYMPGVRKMES